MKNKIILILLLVTNTVLSQNAKNINTLYVQYQSIGDTDGWEHWFTKQATFIKYIHSEIPPVNVPLIIDGKLVVTSDTVLYKKEIEEYIKNETKKTQNRQPISYRENTSEILTFESEKHGKKYFITDTLVPMSEWIIQEDTLTILGYTCQKATTNFYGTEYTAYFTTELGFIGGPKNFRGLPGLILKVENIPNNFGFVAIKMEYPYKGKLPKKPKDGQPISYKTFKVL